MASKAGSERKIAKLLGKLDEKKKQQTELQAKVQAAESRAAAAEEALARAGSVNNENIVSTDNEQVSKLKADLEEQKKRNRKLERLTLKNKRLKDQMAKGASANNANTIATDNEQVSKLKAELEEKKRKLEEKTTENTRLKNQIYLLKRVYPSKRDAKEELLEKELRNSQDIAQKRIVELTLLEAQPLAAAGQVSEAFTRISSTQDDREKNETNHAHAKLIKEHERISKELEKTRAALTRAEKDIEDKTKDIEEIAAARKAAQEGQNAAMDQVMHRLSEISRLKDDFKAYKSHAHALLQKKDAKLSAVKDKDPVAALEAALKDAQRERDLAIAQRNDARQDFEDGIAVGRLEFLINAEQRIRDMARELESTKAQMRSQEKAWCRERQRTLSEVHEQWNLKYKALEAQRSKTDEDLNSFRMNYEKLKVEHDLCREMANKTIEPKDNEISRLLDDNNNLRISLRANHLVQKDHSNNQASAQQDSSVSVVSVAEQQILHLQVLARQQAQREEELVQRQRHIEALQEEIAELERENRLHHQQEVMLKSELQNMDRVQKRDGVDMTYLKDVILKLLETGEVEALLPVIGTLLQFSPEEIRKCQETYNAVPNVPLNGAAAVVDAAAFALRSFFSRFTL